MKFTLDLTLPARIDTARGVGNDMPFVRAVLAVGGVASVFGVNDFVTVIRDPDAEWDPIVCAVQEAAATHLGDEPGVRPTDDPVTVARDLLREAFVAPKPTTVEIRRSHRDDADPSGSATGGKATSKDALGLPASARDADGDR